MNDWKPGQEDRRKSNLDFEVKLEVLINKVENMHKANNESHDRMMDELTRHNDVIFGDGLNPGLSGQMTHLNNAFKNHDKVDDLRVKAIGAILLCILGGLVRLAFMK